MKYLLQSGDVMSRERKCVLSVKPEHAFTAFENLSQHLGDYVPVGSVEFTEEFARLNGVKIPQNITYPPELMPFLKRKVWRDEFFWIDKKAFVKPVRTKAFTGAIKEILSETVRDAEPVWASEPVEFRAEFRFYVLGARILGYSRYDDGDIEDLLPDESVVVRMIDAFRDQPVGFAVDVGLVGEETVLVEVNDGWALGYYPWGNCSQKDYVDLITARWNQIREEK